MSMYEVIGKNDPEYLLSDPQCADVFAISCEPGNGVVKRGTVMYRKTSGMYAPAASANVTASNMLAVLDESVDTDALAELSCDAYPAVRRLADEAADPVVAKNAMAVRKAFELKAKTRRSCDANMSVIQIKGE